ncbi:SpoIIE family protein phosphatase [Geminocystis sp. NIES-3709]|uniref:SpoIIE family protein phosphatase n=1 Tax=Geminocystis sp. NIES-3709 TaxID=1617448 RepID=UPI0005FC7B1A|nr:SpoIIE family protein phosphatase [Geminocystis sp. NIES-3709]BAQ66121.1 serine phosphatase RsbU [Geminocystis sp. NIES-3709]
MTNFETNIHEHHLVKSSLVANLRHDLRTPVNAILGYSEMLLEDLNDVDYSESELENLDDKNSIVIQRHFMIEQLEIIHNNGQEILSIINQLLIENKEDNSPEELKNKLHELKEVMIPLTFPIIEKCEQLKINQKNEDFLSDIERIYSSTIRLNTFLSEIEKLNFLNISEDSKNLSHIPINNFVTIRYPKSVENIDKKITGHILVVDDNKNNRDLLFTQLTREGYTVSTSIDGREALEMIAQKNYDLILLDLLMPEIDGYQVLENIKQDEKKKHIPVIMISALDEMENVIRCIEIGAEDYLPKPFNKTLLKARIGASLEKKNLRDREVEYTKKLNIELDKGREMQLNFLPSQPLKLPNWEIASFFKPARQVAGDFYDTFTLSNHNVVLVLADVCDKGVGAALFMGLFRSLIRIFSRRYSIDGNPTDILENYKPSKTGWISSDNTTNLVHLNALQSVSLTNDYVADNHGDLGMFATMFVGILDPETGLLTYINGGHESLTIIDSHGNIKNKLHSTGAAVGMMADMIFDIKQIYLESGDILFGNTDGVTDARSITREFFREERLEEILRQPFNSAQLLVNTIENKVLQHIGTADQFDDITMLAIRRN